MAEKTPAPETTQASILARIVLTGKLVLATPLRIGTGVEGAGSHEADIYVLKDEAGCPFIPGSSLTGVLRAWMTATHGASMAKDFFGDERASRDKNGIQSSLDVRDIPLGNASITLRDGVCLQEGTGTAKKGGKFNYEAVERGANGKLQIVLTLRRYHASRYDAILSAMKDLAGALHSGIHLGSLTSLGFGKAVCPTPHLYVYDFRKGRAAAAAWLCRAPYGETALPEQAERCAPAGTFRVQASFHLRTSLLVRRRTEEKLDGSNLTITAKPLKSGEDFVLPGASLKGVLRHRAAHILRKLDWQEDAIQGYLEDLMGTANDREGTAKKSRLRVEESYLKKQDARATEAAQARMHADRFTGGVIHLFGEKAVWQQGDAPALTIRYEVRPKKDAPSSGDIGLALLLLKDLWLGDVALGGDKSIGRGRLQGHDATFRYWDADGHEQTWTLDEAGRLTAGDAAPLEAWVQELDRSRG